jgi:DNA-directed RNA polymerase subunit RPC12/RpoP
MVKVEGFRSLIMPECDVCGAQVDRLYLCRTCGVKFCENDGSPKDKICINCSEKEKEKLEAEHEEEREKEHEGEETEKEEEEREEDRDRDLDDYR